MKKTGLLKYFVVLGIVSIILIVIIGVAKSGVLTNTKYEDKKFSSIEECEKYIGINIEVPNIVKESSIQSISAETGTTMYIQSDGLAFKAQSFVAHNVDPLGLYGKSGSMEEYSVLSTKSDIKYIVYRSGYEDNKEITILNWFSDKEAYGLVINKNIELQNMISYINISKEELTEANENRGTSSSNSTDDTITIKFDTMRICDNKYEIKIPNFKSTITNMSVNGSELFYMNSKLFFIIVTDSIEDNKEAYKDGVVVDNGSNGLIIYSPKKMFEENTGEQDDYNLLIYTINKIKESIKAVE